MLADADRTFINIWFPGVAEVVSKLLKKDFISADEYFVLVGTEVGNELLGGAVFSFSYASKQVGFRSMLMKRLFEEKRSQGKIYK